MSITETLRGLGGWSVNLENIPQDLLDKIKYFGHIAVHIGRVDYRTEGDAALTSSRYTGVVRKKEGTADQLLIAGPGMAMWLGDEDQKGSVIETLTTFTGTTFENTIRGLLPASGAITEGTLYNIGQNFTGSFQFLSPREAIDYVCTTLDAVWRVKGNGTLDAGLESDLFITNPKTVLERRNSGVDMVLRSFLGEIKTQQDVEDFSTRVVLLAQGTSGAVVSADADINPGLNPYKDVHGNFVELTRLVSESTTDSGNAAARAQLQLNRFSDTRNAITLSSSDYDIRGDLSVGDYLWVHDPSLELINLTNEVNFRGRLIYPIKLQLTELTTPLDTRMSIGYRDWNGVWYNLTDYFVVESGNSTLVVGGYNRSLTGGDGGTVGPRPQPDTTVPGVPTWNTPFAMSVYQSPVNGDTKAQVQLSWTRPDNVDSSTITDGDHYDIRWRNSTTPLFPVRWGQLATQRWGAVKLAGGKWGAPIQYAVGDWNFATAPWSELTYLLQELTPSMPYEVQIRAVDAATPPNAGAWSSLTNFQTLADTIPPSDPAPPSVAASKLAVQITHTLGRASGGTYNLDLDLHHLEVHGESEPNFQPSDSTVLGKVIANSGMITGHVPVVASFNIDNLFPTFFKVIAVDTAGNKSQGSVAVPATAELIDDAHITDLTVSKVTAGTISSDWLVGANIATGSSGRRVGLNAGGLYCTDEFGIPTFTVQSGDGNIVSTGNMVLGGDLQLPGELRILDGANQVQAELGFLSDSSYGMALRSGAGEFLKLSDFIFGPQTAYVGTSETTTSTSFTDMGTYGPAVSVFIGDTRRAMVIVSAFITQNGFEGDMWYVVAGATTIGTQPGISLGSQGPVLNAISYVSFETNLNPGYNVFTAKYRSINPLGSGGTNQSTFAYRRITVLPY